MKKKKRKRKNEPYSPFEIFNGCKGFEILPPTSECEPKIFTTPFWLATDVGVFNINEISVLGYYQRLVRWNDYFFPYHINWSLN